MANYFGNASNNTYPGTSSKDVIFGFGGNDLLNGGAGKDVLVGGNGNDQFVFNTALNASTNVDTITDFQNLIWILQSHPKNPQ